MIPIHAARFRPFRKSLAFPTAPIRAVAVTGPTPGISLSRWQASFSFAVCIEYAEESMSIRLQKLRPRYALYSAIW
jgi:hypothetical protein